MVLQDLLVLEPPVPVQPRVHQQKQNPASVTSLKKGIAFSPLWPLWPLWCLCVASVEIRHCVHSSMEFRFFFIEESTQCLFSTEATQRHHRGHRGHRGENAMPFSREVTEAPLFFLRMSRLPH